MILCRGSDSEVLKSPEHDFKYLHWTISKMLSWNMFTCKGTYMIVIGSCGTYCRTVWTLERIWNIFLRCGKMKQSEPIYIFMHPYSPFPRRWDSWKTDWVWKIARPCIWVWKIARPCIWFKWTDPLSLSHLSHDDLKTPFSLSHLSHVLQLVPTYPILSYHLSFTNSLFWDFFLGLKLPFHFSKNTLEWKACFKVLSYWRGYK